MCSWLVDALHKKREAGGSKDLGAGNPHNPIYQVRRQWREYHTLEEAQESVSGDVLQLFKVKTPGWTSSSQGWRRQCTARDPYQARILLMLLGLTLATSTPPLPDVDRLRCALRTGVVVMHGELVHGNVRRTVQRHKRKLRQVDLVFLVEDLLPRIEVRCRLLRQEQLVQGRVAVEVEILPVWRELVAGE
jgi:hypothetical protein